MSKFIKLHTLKGNEILINVDNILFVTANIDNNAKEANATICFGLCHLVDTRETPEEIEEMLTH